MGLLDNLLGSLTGRGQQSGVQGELLNAVMGMLANKGTGGLNGLVEGFTKNGLGNIISSWVGTGENLPISPEQLAKGLGRDKIAELASSAGISYEQVTSTLSKILPQVVDKLTPEGKIPTSDLLQQGMNMLKGLKF